MWCDNIVSFHPGGKVSNQMGRFQTKWKGSYSGGKGSHPGGKVSTRVETFSTGKYKLVN